MPKLTDLDPSPWSIDAVDRYTITSVQGGGLAYEIGIGLPASYPMTHRLYPAVVVLDGNLIFATALESSRIQAATGEVAEVIVIGVGTPRVEGLGAHSLRRLRDLTPAVPSMARTDSAIARLLLDRIAAAGLTPEQAFGGADAFLAFLVQQLLPWATQRYRIDGNDLGLFGHSAGGVFAVHALMSPAVPFTRYAIGSFPATWLGDELPAREAALREQSRSRPSRVFFGIGGAELQDAIIAPAMRAGMALLQRIADVQSARIELTRHIFPDETHTSVISHLLSSALRWHYSTGHSYSQAVALRNAESSQSREP